MTMPEKLAAVKAMLGITDGSEDALLTVYLTAAKDEILAWRYGYTAGYNADTPAITDVPREYEQTQISAVVAGYGIRGAENQTSHAENGISRSFDRSDMISYIHAHVRAICGVM